MIQALRGKKASIFVKIILGFVFLGFIGFGAPEFFRTFNQSSPVAKVGSSEISRQVFLQSLQRISRDPAVQSSLSDLLNQNISQFILDNLIQQALIEQQIQDFDLVIDQKTLIHSLMQIPQFKDASHNFDAQKFEQFLKSSPYDEQTFLSKFAQEMMQKQFLTPLFRNTDYPFNFSMLMMQQLAEQRDVSIIEIPHNRIRISQPNSEEILKAFYEENKEMFQHPEYRKFSVLTIDPETIKQTIDVSEENIKSYYETHKEEEFASPEKRTLYFKTFDTEEAALKAYQDKLYDKSWRKLGDVTAQDIRPELAAAAFAQNQTGFVSPITMDNQSTVVYIQKIHPKKPPKSLEVVKGKIIEAVQAEKETKVLQDLLKRIDDEIAAGTDLKELAQIESLQIIESPYVTKNGHTEESDIPDALMITPEMIKEAFELEANMTSTILESNQGIYFIVKTHDIKEAHIPSYATVKNKVFNAYKKDQQNKEAKKQADILTQQINNTKKVSPTLKAKHYKKISRLKQNKAGDSIASDLLLSAFDAAPYQAVVHQGEEQTFVIFVENIWPTSLISLEKEYQEEIKAISKNILTDDFQEAFFKDLKDLYDVKINKDVLESLAAENM